MSKALAVFLLLLAGCATSTPVVRSTGVKAAIAPRATATVAAPIAAPAVQTLTLGSPQLAVPLNYNLTFSWNPVTSYVNGAPLPGKPLYKLYNMNNPKLPGFIGYSDNGATTTQYKVAAPGQQCFAITAEVWDPNADESAKTSIICVVVAPIDLQ